MYCKNCGKQINDNASVCIYCGVTTNQNSSATQTNTLAIVGFVLSFFIAIAGLICSIIGLKKSHALDGTGKGLAIAGIVISSISIALTALVVIILLASLLTI